MACTFVYVRVDESQSKLGVTKRNVLAPTCELDVSAVLTFANLMRL